MQRRPQIKFTYYGFTQEREEWKEWEGKGRTQGLSVLIRAIVLRTPPPCDEHEQQRPAATRTCAISGGRCVLARRGAGRAWCEPQGDRDAKPLREESGSDEDAEEPHRGVENWTPPSQICVNHFRQKKIHWDCKE
jgi:hypothetical protein